MLYKTIQYIVKLVEAWVRTKNVNKQPETKEVVGLKRLKVLQDPNK